MIKLPKFNRFFRSLFIIKFSSFWVLRSFDLGNLGVLRMSPVNIFNDYIFEISRFHWSKCTVECAIYSILILKSAQARCGIRSTGCDFVLKFEDMTGTIILTTSKNISNPYTINILLFFPRNHLKNLKADQLSSCVP